MPNVQYHFPVADTTRIVLPGMCKKHKSESIMRQRAAKDPNIALGVGSGGNQWGEKNHQYKGGRSDYRRCFKHEHPDQRCCEICTSTRNLVVHHVDKNRRNNRSTNLMMLCRSCHAQVHGLVAHLGETPLVYREDVLAQSFTENCEKA